MSSPLALAAVTATLCDVLKRGLAGHDLSPVGTFSVGSLPPDRIETGNNELNRLNVFLYQITPNQGWRNQGLPAFDAFNPKGRLSNPPLALDLHYMLTAYGSADFAAEILLGCAMEVLHEVPLLSRTDIRTVLDPTNPISVALIPPDAQSRSALDLAGQIEQIKVSPHYLTSEELARMWTSMQARYRPSVAYQVSTVLIQGKRPVRSPLPVLTRGMADKGVKLQPNINLSVSAIPTLLSIRVVLAESNARDSAELGDIVEFSGSLLEGKTVTAEFRHPLLSTPHARPVEAGITATQARVQLPQSRDNALPGFDANASEEWPAGAYTVTLRIERDGKPVQRTNPLQMNLAPRFTVAPKLSGSVSNSELKLEFTPHLWPGQSLEIYLGGEAFHVDPVADKTASLAIGLTELIPPEGSVPVRMRVDGIETQLVRDRTLQPPEFDPEQCVTLRQ